MQRFASRTTRVSNTSKPSSTYSGSVLVPFGYDASSESLLESFTTDMLIHRGTNWLDQGFVERPRGCLPFLPFPEVLGSPLLLPPTARDVDPCPPVLL